MPQLKLWNFRGKAKGHGRGEKREEGEGSVPVHPELGGKERVYLTSAGGEKGRGSERRCGGCWKKKGKSFKRGRGDEQEGGLTHLK